MVRVDEERSVCLFLGYRIQILLCRIIFLILQKILKCIEMCLKVMYLNTPLIITDQYIHLKFPPR